MTAVFDFGAFPPEVNSAKMYAGPGSTSMLAAAAAWNGLASELRSQAANYSSIISNLIGEGWQGQASTCDGGCGRAVHGVDEHDSCTGRADGRPGDGRRGRLRGGLRDDRATAGDCGQPDPAGVVGGDERAGAERAGDRGHRSPLRPDVGAGRRGDVRLCGTVVGGDQGAVVHDRAADHSTRCARRAGGRDVSGRQHQHAGGLVAADLCGTQHAARDGLAGDIHVLVHLGAVGARGSAEQRLIGQLPTRQRSGVPGDPMPTSGTR